MNVVEKEAIKYSRILQHTVPNISNLKNKLTSKLYDFTSEKDKLYFLSVLRNSIKESKIEHEKHCTGCGKSDEYSTMLFVIEREYEDINKYFEPKMSSEDEFSTDEQINLHNKINEIIENLSHLKMGQEILFDELDTLRQYFNIDKKSWFQLLRSKLVDVCTASIIDKTVVAEIYNGLANEVNNVTTYIETQV